MIHFIKMSSTIIKEKDGLLVDTPHLPHYSTLLSIHPYTIILLPRYVHIIFEFVNS